MNKESYFELTHEHFTDILGTCAEMDFFYSGHLCEKFCEKLCHCTSGRRDINDKISLKYQIASIIYGCKDGIERRGVVGLFFFDLHGYKNIKDTSKLNFTGLLNQELNNILKNCSC